MLGFGFIFVSGFALVPAMIVVAITEAFYIRGALTYAVGGGLVGLACYLGLVPFDAEQLRFEGIVRRHLEIMTGAGIARRRGLLDDRGPQCRRLAHSAAAAPAAAADAFAIASRRHREGGLCASLSPKSFAQVFSSLTVSAKPRAMNRTGLIVALALALVVGLLFGIFPELDLKLGFVVLRREPRNRFR